MPPPVTCAPALAPLFQPLTALPGVGPKRAALLGEACGGPRVLDLLFHLPERVERRADIAHPREAPAAGEARLPVVARSHRHVPRRYVDVRCDELTIRLMNSWPSTAERQFPIGQTRWISAALKPDGDRWLCFNPTVATAPEELPLVQPVWSLVDKLSPRDMANAVAAALALLGPEWPEWADAALLAREGWPGFAQALRALHQPATHEVNRARERLAYDEALAGQLALALLRRRRREETGRALPGTGLLQEAALRAFGHAPTPSQRQALSEIAADLAAPRRMLRLLQGDVGSGKTLVAVLAMLQAVESGAQAALMAPTELLARQHARSIGRLCAAAGVEAALLAGSVKGAERRRVLEGLADGTIRVAIGTHALFQEGVAFHDLGLAVVDEQHRFGVEQRLRLANKGRDADVLVMTATPIPRTLQLTQWGEMDSSRLEGKPAGRQPITTRLADEGRIEEIISRVGAALERGERAYWVVRSISGGEREDQAAAEERFARLSKRFPGRVALAHGLLDTDVREASLRAFADGRTPLLVATTVVEVGVDVPEATIMLVEQAELFGLSQLHQLRGRVGRGPRPSSCLLVHSAGLTDTERRRLSILRETEDGFAIAEHDLAIRKGGDAAGTRQAGEFFRLGLRDEERRISARQRELVAIARRDADALLERDPRLAETPRGPAARLLLGLFERADPASFLAAG